MFDPFVCKIENALQGRIVKICVSCMQINKIQKTLFEFLSVGNILKFDGISNAVLMYFRYERIVWQFMLQNNHGRKLFIHFGEQFNRTYSEQSRFQIPK